MSCQFGCRVSWHRPPWGDPEWAPCVSSSRFGELPAILSSNMFSGPFCCSLLLLGPLSCQFHIPEAPEPTRCPMNSSWVIRCNPLVPPPSRCPGSICLLPFPVHTWVNPALIFPAPVWSPDGSQVSSSLFLLMTDLGFSQRKYEGGLPRLPHAGSAPPQDPLPSPLPPTPLPQLVPLSPPQALVSLL